MDHHHRSLYEPAARTPEGQLGRAGLVRRAAAGVRALTAVPEPVGLGAVTALVDEPDGAWGGEAGLTVSLLTPHRSPRRRLHCVAGSHFTKSRLHLQPAGWVLVGDPGGDPGPAALGAGAPLGAPLHTWGGSRGGFVKDVVPGESGPQWARPHGCDGVLDHRVLQVLTHPLSAALPRQLDELRVWTVWSGMSGR